jgi:hypothetical protein
MALKELTNITEHLREMVMTRWTDSDILDHVVIKLPAPIFDKMSEELKADTINLPWRSGQSLHVKRNQVRAHRWTLLVAQGLLTC